MSLCQTAATSAIRRDDKAKHIGIFAADFYHSKFCHGALVPFRSFCYMLPRRRKSAYHDAVVAELVDAQR